MRSMDDSAETTHTGADKVFQGLWVTGLHTKGLYWRFTCFMSRGSETIFQKEIRMSEQEVTQEI